MQGTAKATVGTDGFSTFALVVRSLRDKLKMPIKATGLHLCASSCHSALLLPHICSLGVLEHCSSLISAESSLETESDLLTKHTQSVNRFSNLGVRI